MTALGRNPAAEQASVASGLSKAIDPVEPARPFRSNTGPNALTAPAHDAVDVFGQFDGEADLSTPSIAGTEETRAQLPESPGKLTQPRAVIDFDGLVEERTVSEPVMPQQETLATATGSKRPAVLDMNTDPMVVKERWVDPNGSGELDQGAAPAAVTGGRTINVYDTAFGVTDVGGRGAELGTEAEGHVGPVLEYEPGPRSSDDEIWMDDAAVAPPPIRVEPIGLEDVGAGLDTSGARLEFGGDPLADLAEQARAKLERTDLGAMETLRRFAGSGSSLSGGAWWREGLAEVSGPEAIGLPLAGPAQPAVIGDAQSVRQAQLLRQNLAAFRGGEGGGGAVWRRSGEQVLDDAFAAGQASIRSQASSRSLHRA
jgi:hypothetical protein